MAGRETGEAGVGAGATLPALEARLAKERLDILGGFAVAEGEAGFPAGTRTLLMLGPKEPGFWPHLQTQPEWDDPDPVDRWSRRLLDVFFLRIRSIAILSTTSKRKLNRSSFHPLVNWLIIIFPYMTKWCS